MERAIVVGITAFAANALLFGIPLIVAKRVETHEIHDEYGRISLPRGLTIFYIVVGLAFVGAGALAAVADPGMAWAGLILIVFFSYGIWGTVIASKKEGSVVWDDQGIEGPCRMYPIPFRCNRKRMSWQSIVAYQERSHGIVVMKCRDGTKLIWSTLFPGADFLKDLIHRKCPGVEFK